jgi:2,3-diketo-5-methylthio-1-phosphopentane phosphatase
MATEEDKWIIVTDFDGTLTQKDVGNELCKLFANEKFIDLQGQYRQGKLNLKDYQIKMWEDFPCSEEQFSEASKRIGSLRPGVNEFLEACLHKKVPVYIASCGIEQYIQSVIESFVSGFARESIKELKCNKAVFSGNKLSEFIMPDSKDPSLPLHKGLWAQELAQKHQAKVICIGNGSSDRSFVGYADQIAATDAFYTYCVENKHSCLNFNNFFDLLKSFKFLH